MNRGPTQKRQRQALEEASLSDPQSLLRAPAYPPAAGLQVGQFQQQEQQQRGVTRKWQRKKRLQQPQLQQQHQQQQQQRQQRWRLSMHASTAVACPNVRSAHEARMKEHLLNIKIRGFLSSTAAAECPAEKVQSKLNSLRQSSSSTTQHQGRQGSILII